MISVAVALGGRVEKPACPTWHDSGNAGNTVRRTLNYYLYLAETVPSHPKHVFKM